MNDPFEGLYSHVERYLGRVTHGQAATGADGSNRGFLIGYHAHPRFRMVSAATTGVRYQRVAAVLPQEIVVSALPEQEAEAGYLAHSVAERVIRSELGLVHGGGYFNAVPLINGTGIEFLMAAQHPFVETEFDLFRDDRGEPALHFITVIPATRAEYEFMQQHEDGDEELLDLWKSRDTDLLDLYRESAV